jgi:hypothetical protein
MDSWGAKVTSGLALIVWTLLAPVLTFSGAG